MLFYEDEDDEGQHGRGQRRLQAGHGLVSEKGPVGELEHGVVHHAQCQRPGQSQDLEVMLQNSSASYAMARNSP